MRIGLDFDGVIVDHSEHKIRLAADLGYRFEPWQTNTNVMAHLVPEEQYRNIQDIIYTHLTLQAPPVVESLEHIRKLGGELYILSARRQAAVRFAQDWLQQHGVYDVIPAQRIHFCGKSNEKGDYCRRLGIELFLDDKLAVLKVLDPQVKKYLFDSHGAAAKFGLEHSYNIVSGWQEFASELEKVLA
ncbi:hypothetical protein KKF05_02775 [Patescibacteria group bacterium]|nr:hypothetical protein [Patescibacteria group bacterium]MBU1029362.1 hypothetical protein [Patescibacteria group bacterium]MBU1915575.1 hypothetical protein [Patescibacteria group bacterium]